MSTEQKTFAEICSDLESKLCDLKSMAAILDTCVNGDIAGTASRTVNKGFVMITEHQAEAIYWIAMEIASRIRDAHEAFNADYGAALKGLADAAA